MEEYKVFGQNGVLSFFFPLLLVLCILSRRSFSC